MKDSEAIRILGDTTLCTPLGQAAFVGIEAIKKLQEYRTLGTIDEIQNKMKELARWHSDRLNSRIKNEFACMSTLICRNCNHKDEYIEELEAEIEEYRAIGTAEEIQDRLQRLQQWHDEHLEDITVDIAEYRELCKVEEAAHFKSLKRIIQRNGTIGKALEECAEYEAIGTVEECRAAVEKQRAIKSKFEMNYGDFESLFSCECGKKIIVRHNRGVMDNHDGPNYCSKCGKKLDWSDTP